MEIKVLNYEIKEVGKHIKSTKKKYAWKLNIENKIFQIDLYHSKITLKYEIKINDIRKIKKQTSNQFDYEFKIQKKIIRIRKREEGFELLINNNSFEDICLGNTIEFDSSKDSLNKLNFSNSSKEIFHNRNPNRNNNRNKNQNKKRLTSLKQKKNVSDIINKNFNKRFTDDKFIISNNLNFSPISNKKKVIINVNNTNINDFPFNHNIKEVDNNNKLFFDFQKNVPDFFSSEMDKKEKNIFDLNSSGFILGELKFLPTSD